MSIQNEESIKTKLQGKDLSMPAITKFFVPVALANFILSFIYPIFSAAKENLDGAAIVTPDYLHKEITIYCAEQGIHMLVQKPLDTTTAGANEMVEAAGKNEVLLFVDFHKRYDPGHIQLKKDMQSGRLGNIQYGYVCIEDIIMVPSDWFKTWAQHSSPVWFIGVHFYDLLGIVIFFESSANIQVSRCPYSLSTSTHSAAIYLPRKRLPVS